MKKKNNNKQYNKTIVENILRLLSTICGRATARVQGLGGGTM